MVGMMGLVISTTGFASLWVENGTNTFALSNTFDLNSPPWSVLSIRSVPSSDPEGPALIQNAIMERCLYLSPFLCGGCRELCWSLKRVFHSWYIRAEGVVESPIFRDWDDESGGVARMKVSGHHTRRGGRVYLMSKKKRRVRWVTKSSADDIVKAAPSSSSLEGYMTQ